MPNTSDTQFFICIANEGYAVSLETRKIYIGMHAPDAEQHNLVSIIDESGDAYLYPRTMFCAIALPQGIQKAVLAAA